MARSMRSASVLFLLVMSAAGLRAQVPGKSDWSRVRHLSPATRVVVALTRGGVGTYFTAFADDAVLVLVQPVGRRLSQEAEQAITTVGPNWPAVLAGHNTIVGQVTVTRTALIEHGVATAGVLQIPRAIVSEVRWPDDLLLPNTVVKSATIGMLVAASASGSTLKPPSPYYYDRFNPAYAPGIEPWDVLASNLNEQPDDDVRLVYAAPGPTALTEPALQRIVNSVGPLGVKR